MKQNIFDNGHWIMNLLQNKYIKMCNKQDAMKLNHSLGVQVVGYSKKILKLQFQI